MAYHCYQSILKSFPDNIDCLKFLVRLSTDQGLTDDSAHYNELLRRAEKSLEAKKQVIFIIIIFCIFIINRKKNQVVIKLVKTELIVVRSSNYIIFIIVKIRGFWSCC